MKLYKVATYDCSGATFGPYFFKEENKAKIFLSTILDIYKLIKEDNIKDANYVKTLYPDFPEKYYAVNNIHHGLIFYLFAQDGLPEIYEVLTED